eukprot:TRINITY_DN10903_c0_g1_i3.p2 TRINITY_DN10903_c0_g1~~TRINITY_DN10903_c0_g1_i3.p2  ORF type:complete len:136 (+),score=30.32 TRINITY_DN10903_c0_g1_i3:22-429(+)
MEMNKIVFFLCVLLSDNTSCFIFFFFFKQKTAYEMLRSLVGSEMCIRDSVTTVGVVVVLAVEVAFCPSNFADPILRFSIAPDRNSSCCTTLSTGLSPVEATPNRLRDMVEVRKMGRRRFRGRIYNQTTLVFVTTH